MKIKIFKTNCHIDVKSVEDDINDFLTNISEKDVIKGIEEAEQVIKDYIKEQGIKS